MSQTIISAETIDGIVQACWTTVIEKVNKGHPLSSEKTLCFLFAMALSRVVGSDLVIDFENQCYEGLAGDSKYLDLLFYTSPNFKVAVEFKLPRSSTYGGSNQPQTRQNVYRDIARLHYLRHNSIVAGACYFLMAINESAYLNKGQYRSLPELLVHHGHKVHADNTILASGLLLTGAEFEFKWQYMRHQGLKYICDNNYAWLTPMKIN